MTLINNLLANNLPIIFDDMEKWLGNKKGTSTFGSLKNVSNADQLIFTKNIFIPCKSFVFRKKSDDKVDRPFQHSAIFSLNMGHIGCTVLLNGGSSCRKIKLVNTPFKAWSDVQSCFRRHSESNTGILTKLMNNYKEFVKHVSW